MTKLTKSKKTLGQRSRGGRVNDDVPEGVGDISPARVLDKVSRREEASVAHAHYPHLLALPVLVQYPVDSPSVGAIPFCENARHVFHHTFPTRRRLWSPAFVLVRLLGFFLIALNAPRRASCFATAAPSLRCFALQFRIPRRATSDRLHRPAGNGRPRGRGPARQPHRTGPVRRGKVLLLLQILAVDLLQTRRRRRRAPLLLRPPPLGLHPPQGLQLLPLPPLLLRLHRQRRRPRQRRRRTRLRAGEDRNRAGDRGRPDQLARRALVDPKSTSEHGQRLLVYEYIGNGSLHDMLHFADEGGKVLSWNARVRVALGTARALEYLHEVCLPSIVHRNFKSANILLDEELNPHLSDCGLAALTPNTERQVSTQMVGSFGYSAPEFALSGVYTVKSDVYSFGVVMLELLTGRKPLDSSRVRSEQSLVRWATPQLHDIDSLANMVDPTLNGMYPSKSLSRFADIIALCVQPEPEFRPPMLEVVQALVRLVQRASVVKRRSSDDSGFSYRTPDHEAIDMWF